MLEFEFPCPDSKKTFYLLRLLLISLAGIAQSLSLALPWTGDSSAFLQIISLAIFIGALSDVSDCRSGCLFGFTFAIFWLGTTCWWLYISLHQYGGLPSWLSITILLCMDLLLSSYYAAVTGLFIYLRKGTAAEQYLFRCILFSALWTFGELLRGSLLTGFPWGAGGYAQVDGLGRTLAPWVGVYGSGAAAAFLAALLAETFKNSKFYSLLLIVALAFVSKLPMYEWPASTSKISISLLQGNVPQNEKFNYDTGIPWSLNWYSKELKSNSSDIVITPETAIPIFLDQLPDRYLDNLSSVPQNKFIDNIDENAPHPTSRHEKTILLGVPIRDNLNKYTNSMIAIDINGKITHRYDKNHLVPFGEYFPNFFSKITDILHIPLANFTRGDDFQTPMEVHDQRLAINICYEDLFGEDLSRSFLNAENAPTILVNASNIGWFGNTLVIDQHLQIARMRALEFSRPVISATNTGATAIIDHQGRVMDKLPPFTKGVLSGVVIGRGTQMEGGWGVTPYSIWVSRFHLWPIWTVIFFIIIFAFIQVKIKNLKKL